jgi:hypothetical protein
LAARPELHRNCAIIFVAQFGGAAFAKHLWRRATTDLTGLDLGISTFVILVETLGELLKFVVNSRLPIGWLKQSITSLSRAVGIKLAAAEWSRVDLS